MLELHLVINYNHGLATEERVTAKTKKALSESTGYKEFVIKSIAYFIIICMLHILYFTKIYNTIYVYILHSRIFCH